MEDIEAFLARLGINQDFSEENTELAKRTRRAKRLAIVGGAVALAGYRISKNNPKRGEFIMAAGVIPTFIVGLYNWSERDKPVTKATDKAVKAIFEHFGTQQNNEQEPSQKACENQINDDSLPISEPVLEEVDLRPTEF